MKKMLLLTLALTCLTLNVFAGLGASQTCRKIFGNGPFDRFTIKYQLAKELKIRSIEVLWSGSAGRAGNQKESLSGLIDKKRSSLDTFLTTLIIEIPEIDGWGAGVINIGEDDQGQSSALVDFTSDSAENRGLYECDKFPASFASSK